MYKSILVHVDADDPTTADRVASAATLALRWHATLIGAAASLTPQAIEVLAEGPLALPAGAVGGDPRELEQRFEDAEALFKRSLGETGIQSEWRATMDFPAQGLANMAARADLLVVGRAKHSSPANSYLDYGDLVMQAGRPLLVLPSGSPTLIGRNALVAWRNTKESRRAVADALPLLAAASEVHLVHVPEKNMETKEERTALDDAMAHLSRHGIAAITHVVSAGPLTTTDRILKMASHVDAAFIVSGAYGHGRVREWVFGGMKRDLLHDSPLPSLLSR